MSNAVAYPTAKHVLDTASQWSDHSGSTMSPGIQRSCTQYRTLRAHSVVCSGLRGYVSANLSPCVFEGTEDLDTCREV